MFICSIQSKVRYWVLFCIILVYNLGKSQIHGNLISNPSFEILSSCPSNLGDIGKAQGWFNGNQAGTPDLYAACSTVTIAGAPFNLYGNQTAKSGTNYTGIAVYAREFETREYIETQLLTSLLPNKSYCITYNVSLAELSRYSVGNCGGFFSPAPLTNTIVFPTPFFYYWTPHVESDTLVQLNDTLGWMKVEKSYVAQGGENYFTIGNFRSDIRTQKQQIKTLDPFQGNGTYYYIDDVSVVEINPAKAFNTKTITACVNTTYTLGTDSTFDATYSWMPETGLSCTNCPNPVITTSINIKYVLTKQQCSATTKDSVYIQIYTPTVTANAGNYKNICSNDTVKLGVNDTTAFTNYLWQPATGLTCTNCPQPVAMPFTSTTYTLNKTECALNSNDTVTIKVDDCDIVVPDIFTPNNDNVNDEWFIRLPFGFKLNVVAVYNRWGTLIYTLDDKMLMDDNSKIRTVKWDGRTSSGLECAQGVYFYVMHYTDKNGNLNKLNGSIQLLR